MFSLFANIENNFLTLGYDAPHFLVQNFYGGYFFVFGRCITNTNKSYVEFKNKMFNNRKCIVQKTYL